jgi:hypothetical protein
VIRSVPRLRAQFRQGPRGARLPGILPGHIMDAIGEQLAGSLEIGATLLHVAEMLVPQFADHCFIDLFQGDALLRRVQRHAGGWTPPAGTWAQVGEQIRYPQGHFCQRAMARLDTIIVNDLAEDRGTATRRPVLCDSQGGGNDISPRRAPVCPRGAARRDEPGPIGPNRQNRTTLLRGGPVPHRRDREPGRGRDRPRDNRTRTSARPRRPLINRTRNILDIAVGGTSPPVDPRAPLEATPEEGRGFYELRRPPESMQAGAA